MTKRQPGKPGKAPFEVNLLKEHLPDAAVQRLYAQDLTIILATATIAEAMKKAGINQAELAERIGKSKGFVSQVLNGTRNMTLKTFADFLSACDREVQRIEVRPIGQSTVPCELIDEWLDGDSQARVRVESIATPAQRPVPYMGALQERAKVVA